MVFISIEPQYIVVWFCECFYFAVLICCSELAQEDMQVRLQIEDNTELLNIYPVYFWFETVKEDSQQEEFELGIFVECR